MELNQVIEDINITIAVLLMPLFQRDHLALEALIATIVRTYDQDR